MDKQSIIDKVNHIKSELLALAKQVRELPPNPNAEPLGNNCFSLNSSELGKHNRWDVRYHLFHSQYETIAEYLEECPIDTALQKLDTIIDKQQIIHNQCLTVFHPQVIENLKNLIK